jgi:hypothetical protein
MAEEGVRKKIVYSEVETIEEIKESDKTQLGQTFTYWIRSPYLDFENINPATSFNTVKILKLTLSNSGGRLLG